MLNTGQSVDGVEEKWPAPAKLNLFLHVTGCRQDGYHLLQSAIQFVNICDELSFSVRSDGVIRCVNTNHSIAGETDLTVRAARLLQHECSIQDGVDIHLKKVIPAGAGLGGVSSDAATALLALNRIWGCNLDRKDLEVLGAGLGADVPVFVRGEASWVEGIGERLQAMDFPEVWYVIVYPGVHLDTRQMFADPGLDRNCPPIHLSDFALQQTQNVFEPIARQHAEVERAWQWLSQHSQVRLTGSGSCLFAPCESKHQAGAIAAVCPADFTVFAAKGMNRSPVCSLSQYN